MAEERNIGLSPYFVRDGKVFREVVVCDESFGRSLATKLYASLAELNPELQYPVYKLFEDSEPGASWKEKEFRTSAKQLFSATNLSASEADRITIQRMLNAFFAKDVDQKGRTDAFSTLRHWYVEIPESYRRSSPAPHN